MDKAMIERVKNIISEMKEDTSHESQLQLLEVKKKEISEKITLMQKQYDIESELGNIDNMEMLDKELRVARKENLEYTRKINEKRNGTKSESKEEVQQQITNVQAELIKQIQTKTQELDDMLELHNQYIEKTIGSKRTLENLSASSKVYKFVHAEFEAQAQAQAELAGKRNSLEKEISELDELFKLIGNFGISYAEGKSIATKDIEGFIKDYKSNAQGAKGILERILKRGKKKSNENEMEETSQEELGDDTPYSDKDAGTIHLDYKENIFKRIFDRIKSMFNKIFKREETKLLTEEVSRLVGEEVDVNDADIDFSGIESRDREGEKRVITLKAESMYKDKQKMFENAMEKLEVLFKDGKVTDEDRMEFQDLDPAIMSQCSDENELAQYVVSMYPKSHFAEWLTDNHPEIEHEMPFEVVYDMKDKSGLNRLSFWEKVACAVPFLGSAKKNFKDYAFYNKEIDGVSIEKNKSIWKRIALLGIGGVAIGSGAAAYNVVTQNQDMPFREAIKVYEDKIKNDGREYDPNIQISREEYAMEILDEGHEVSHNPNVKNMINTEVKETAKATNTMIGYDKENWGDKDLMTDEYRSIVKKHFQEYFASQGIDAIKAAELADDMDKQALKDFAERIQKQESTIIKAGEER